MKGNKLAILFYLELFIEEQPVMAGYSQTYMHDSQRPLSSQTFQQLCALKSGFACTGFLCLFPLLLEPVATVALEKEGAKDNNDPEQRTELEFTN